MPVPKSWLETVSEFQNQQRSIEFVTLGAAQAGEIPAPTPEQLSKYFDERKILFRAPEYRKIEVIAVTPEELGRWMEIPEADIKAEYDAHRNRYVTPERRHVEQIVFPTMQEAEAAEARLKEGLTFAALAAERGLKDKDIDLGSVSKSEIVDPAVANAAFALKDGEISAPVQGRFGAVIVSVSKIEPEVGKSLAEVTAQIRQEIATGRAKAEVRSLHEKIEEARAGGATLPQIAEKLKLTVTTFDVDRSGHEPSGKVAALPHAGQVIPAAFGSDVGVDNDPIDVEGGYLWYNVAGITPARDRTLDEVKDQVEARWRDDEIANRLKAKSAELLDKLKGGTPLDAVAASAGLKVQTADKLTRTKPEANLPPRVIAAVFHTAKDAFGSSEGDQPTDWVVFRVTDITDAEIRCRLAGNETHRRADKETGKRRDPRAISGLARVRSRLERQPGGVCASARQQRTGHQLDMQIEPSAAAFAARYAAGEAQVVWTTLVGDLETPVSAFLKIADGRPMSFLLELVEGGEVRGRYSIIGLEPDLIFRSNGADGGSQSHAAQQSACVRPRRRGAACRRSAR